MHERLVTCPIVNRPPACLPAPTLHARAANAVEGWEALDLLAGEWPG
jgi:hypothetical protein